MPSKDPIEKLTWDVSPQEAVKKIQFLISTNHVTVPQLAHEIGVQHRTLQDVVDGLAFPTEAMVRRCASAIWTKRRGSDSRRPIAAVWRRRSSRWWAGRPGGRDRFPTGVCRRSPAA